MNEPRIALAALLRAHEEAILAEWLKEQVARASRRDQMHEAEMRATSRSFLNALVDAEGQGAVDVKGPAFARVREVLGELSTSRAQQGYSPTETAIFVLSLKRPLFSRVRTEITGAEAFADAMWEATALLDELGLFIMESFQ